MDDAADNPLSDPYLLELFERNRKALEAGLSIDAEETIEEIFSIVSDWSNRNPSPSWDLTIEAANCEDRGDWLGAEVAYQKILTLADDQHDLYAAHRNLAALSVLLYRETTAIEHRRMATEAARKTNLPILLLMALRDESWTLVHFGHVEYVKKPIDEAFAILQQDDDQNYTQFLCSSLTLRAVCRIADHRLSEAQMDLDRAHDRFEPMIQVKIAAGFQSDLARWWATTGRLRTARQDFQGAVDAWQEAVALAKHVNSLEHCADVYSAFGIAIMLKGLADAQTEAGNIQDARDSISERSSLMELLGLPCDRGY